MNISIHFPFISIDGLNPVKLYKMVFEGNEQKLLFELNNKD